MKKYITVLLLLILQQSYAQSPNSIMGTTYTHYVLDKFYQGKVYLRSGEVSERLLNYNALTREMIFDDKGKYLAIANWQEVDSVVLAGRRFVPADKKFYEWIAGNSHPLYAEYVSTILEEAPSGGYGISSNTTSSSSLKTLIGSGSVYALQLPDNFKVETKVIYYLYKDNTFHKFSNARQLAALLPDKKQFIQQWVKDKATNFTNRQELAALINQVQ